MSSQRVDRSRRNHTHSNFPQSTKFPPKQASSRQNQKQSGTLKPTKTLDPGNSFESNKVKPNENVEQDAHVLNRKIAEVMRDIEETERAINSTRHEIELQQNAIVLHQVLQSNYMNISENINKYVDLFEEEMKCEDERKERVTTGTNVIENTTTIEIGELCELIKKSLKRRESGLSSDAEEEILAESIQNLIRRYPSSEMMKALISSIRLMQRDLKTTNFNNGQTEEKVSEEMQNPTDVLKQIYKEHIHRFAETNSIRAEIQELKDEIRNHLNLLNTRLDESDLGFDEKKLIRQDIITQCEVEACKGLEETVQQTMKQIETELAETDGNAEKLHELMDDSERIKDEMVQKLIEVQRLSSMQKYLMEEVNSTQKELQEQSSVEASLLTDRIRKVEESLLGILERDASDITLDNLERMRCLEVNDSDSRCPKFRSHRTLLNPSQDVAEGLQKLKKAVGLDEGHTPETLLNRIIELRELNNEGAMMQNGIKELNSESDRIIDAVVTELSPDRPNGEDDFTWLTEKIINESKTVDRYIGTEELPKIDESLAQGKNAMKTYQGIHEAVKELDHILSGKISPKGLEVEGKTLNEYLEILGQTLLDVRNSIDTDQL